MSARGQPQGDSPVRGNVAKRQKGCRRAKVAPTMKLIGFNVVTGLAPVIKADVCSRLTV